MRRRLSLAALALAAWPSAAPAEGAVAARTIPARAVLSPADVAAGPADTTWHALLGREARVTVFKGQPIRAADFAPAALVDRNAVVPLVYTQGALVIVTEGRALERGAPGDRIRVMNVASRVTISATVAADGTLTAGPTPLPETE